MYEPYMILVGVFIGIIVGAIGGGVFMWKRRRDVKNVLDNFYQRRDGLEDEAREVLDKIREVF